MFSIASHPGSQPLFLPFAVEDPNNIIDNAYTYKPHPERNSKGEEEEEEEEEEHRRSCDALGLLKKTIMEKAGEKKGELGKGVK